ncbi:MAG: hypothetical protein GQE15_23370 [Archangiaceae bacterium]|nr:hypothetical protein [Archangiaceae bacterium]
MLPFVVGSLLLASPVQVAVRASVFHDSLALPWTQRLDAGLHPGVSLGVEVPLRLRDGHELVLGGAASWWRVPLVQQGASLTAEVGYRFTLRAGLQLEASLGAGPMLEWYDSAAWRDGASTLLPRTQVLLVTGLGAGFDARRVGVPLSFFVRYQPAFQVVASPQAPVLPHVALMAGVRLHLPVGEVTR